MDELFGDHFDELLASEDREPGNANAYSFIPKICEYEWFTDSTSSNDHSSTYIDRTLYSANLLYYKKEYRNALALYRKLLQDPMLPRPMLSEISEAASRCSAKLGSLQEAHSSANLFFDLAKNADHRTNAVFLKVEIYRKEVFKREHLCSELRRLILLHPFNHWLWLEYCTQVSDPVESASCLIRARSALVANRVSTSSFILDQYSASEQEVTKRLDDIAKRLSAPVMDKIAEFVTANDAHERLSKEVPTEEQRLKVLDMSAEEVDKLFTSKWLSFPKDIRNIP